MASGKASRRRRAASKAPTPPVRGTRRALDRRAWLLIGAAVAIVVAVAAGAVLARSDGAPAAAGSTLPEAAEVVALFDGLPQSGSALGRPDAPVTLVEFVDLQCPFCREFEVEALPTLVDRYVRAGKVRIEVRGLAFLGPDSVRGLRAALAAGKQDRLFQLLELLYFNQGAENSGWLSQELIEAAARSVPGLDVARLVEDMDSTEISRLLDADGTEAARLGVDSTPTIFVGRTGGDLTRVMLSSPTDLPAIERAIAAA